MTALEKARALEVEDDLVSAADFYEEAIRSGADDLETLINAAVLYFVCCDGGYAAAHHLDEKFLNRAWERAKELLRLAEDKLGAHPEIDFWRSYFDFVVLGEPASEERWLQLVNSGKTLVPYFYLFGAVHGVNERYREQAEKLFEQVRKADTAKKRYIASILGPRLRETPTSK